MFSIQKSNSTSALIKPGCSYIDVCPAGVQYNGEGGRHRKKKRHGEEEGRRLGTREAEREWTGKWWKLRELGSILMSEGKRASAAGEGHAVSQYDQAFSAGQRMMRCGVGEVGVGVVVGVGLCILFLCAHNCSQRTEWNSTLICITPSKLCGNVFMPLYQLSFFLMSASSSCAFCPW